MKLQRKMPQFRIALNSRCERACFYCRPSGEAVSTDSGISIDPNDVLKVARVLRGQGIESVKLTGGEPALYGPLEEVVYRLRHDAGFREVEVISRHPKIGARARALKCAGVTQFNISLDTLDPSLHREICGVDDLKQILAALSECVATDIPCKVNTVVMAGVNESELSELAAYCDDTGVATLKFLDVISDLDAGKETFVKRLARRRRHTLRDLHVPLDMIRKKFEKLSLHMETYYQGDLGHPMTALTLQSGMKLVFKDSSFGAWYGPVCEGCKFFPCHDALMALRLTADLRLQFCLLGEHITVPLSEEVLACDIALEKTITHSLSQYSGVYFRKSPVDEQRKVS